MTPLAGVPALTVCLRPARARLASCSHVFTGATQPQIARYCLLQIHYYLMANVGVLSLTQTKGFISFFFVLFFAGARSPP